MISESEKDGLIKENERLDDLQRNGLMLIQDPEKFCFGIDAVLLSYFTRLKPGGKILDMGTGTGVIPILLSARTSPSEIDGLEIQEESADMAQRSVIYNELENIIHIKQGDLCHASEIYGRSVFDAVTCNPPYMINDHGRVNQNSMKAAARHEILCTLEDVIREASSVLKPNGHFFMIHRPFRLTEIINDLLKYRLQPKRMRFIHPFTDREPTMVLIESCAGGNYGVKIEKPLIIYKSPGVYTDEIHEIYGGTL